MIEKGPGIIECVDQCPDGTYLNINYCVSCGKTCDVNTPIALNSTHLEVNPINAAIMKTRNSQNIIFIQKGLNSHQ